MGGGGVVGGGGGGGGGASPTHFRVERHDELSRAKALLACARAVLGRRAQRSEQQAQPLTWQQKHKLRRSPTQGAGRAAAGGVEWSGCSGGEASLAPRVAARAARRSSRLQLGYSSATARLQLGYSSATSRLPLGYPSAPARLHLGYLLATSWLQLGSSSAASKPHLAEALSEQPRCAAVHVLHAALLAHATQLPNHRLGGDPLAPRLLSHGRRRRVGHAASAPAQRLFLLRDVDARDLEKGVERPRSDEMESGTRHIRPCGDMCPPTRP